MQSNSIRKDSVKLLSVTILSMGLSLISLSLLSHFRSLDEYGTYSQIVLITSLAYSVFALGLPSSVNYFLAGENNIQKQTTFIQTYYMTNAFLGLMCGLLLLLLMPFIVTYFKNDLISQFGFALLLMPWSRLTNAGIENQFIIYNKSSQLMWFKLRYGITTILVVLISYFLNLSFLTYMIIFISTEVFFSLWVFYISWKITGIVPFGCYYSFSMLKKILAFSIPIGISAIVTSLNVELSKLVATNLTDLKTFAVYANTSKELPFAVIVTSISVVLIPHIRRLLKEKNYIAAVALWRTSINLTFIIMCFLSMFLILFAPLLIKLLYSSKYLSGTNVFMVSSLIPLLRLTNFGIILSCIGKTKYILWSSMITLILNIVLIYVLFKIFGIIGLAMANLISIFALDVILLIFTSKKINIKLVDILDFKFMLKILLINALIGIIAFQIVKSLSLDSFLSYIYGILIILAILFTYFLCVRKDALKDWQLLR